jgi:hypothetical protein
MTDKWNELEKKRAELPEYHTTKIPGCDDLIEGMMQGRLMRKLEGGSYEVVGYQVWLNGSVRHYSTNGVLILSLSGQNGWFGDCIAHDRFDRYAYVTQDHHHITLFERDEVRFLSYEKETLEGIVVFRLGGFMVKVDHVFGCIHTAAKLQIEVTGIVGVDKTGKPHTEATNDQKLKNELTEIKKKLKEMSEVIEKMEGDKQ